MAAAKARGVQIGGLRQGDRIGSGSHDRARKSLHPAQAEMQELLRKALDDLQEGVAATKRAVLERCQLNDSYRAEALEVSPAKAA
jgi:hypothetical protein